MANCKDDFLKATKGKNVLCAEITYGSDYLDDEQRNRAILTVGHSEAAMQRFLHDINYLYDSGYGGQEVYGTIWYTDGTWSEREEYDGSECWVHKSCPAIPDELQGV